MPTRHRALAVTAALAASALGAAVASDHVGAAAPTIRNATSAPLHRQVNGVLTPPGFFTASFAGTAFGATKPDDITTMRGNTYVGWQDGVGSAGEPSTDPSTSGQTNSTLVEYSRAGVILAHWSIPGKIDGMVGDDANDRVLVTRNEDGNSAMSSVHPDAPGTAQSQVVALQYLDSQPSTIGTPGSALSGGSDAVVISGGIVYIVASNANNGSGGADPSQAIFDSVDINEGAHTATLTVVLHGNSAATTTDPNNPANLNIADADSSGQVPPSVPTYGGSVYISGQSDRETAFYTPGQPTRGVLVGASLNDVVWPSSNVGTLFVTDGSKNVVDAVFGTTWDTTKAVASVPAPKSTESATGGGYLATVDYSTGNVTALMAGFGSPAGLMFVPGNTNQGYWQVAADGGIFPFGNAIGYGSTGNVKLNQPVVGMGVTADGGGYWLVASDGGIFPFGDAFGYGSTGNVRLNKPIVGIAPTPTGNGYYEVASDGGLFPFGDAAAHSYGSLGNVTLNKPIIGMAVTPTGKGYWMVASDGGIFPFGDAFGYGSAANLGLTASVVGMAALADGSGYYLVTSTGAVLPFGNAVARGNLANVTLNKPVIGIQLTQDNGGYWLIAGDGGVFPFGDAQGIGSEGGVKLNQPIVGLGGLPV